LHREVDTVERVELYMYGRSSLLISTYLLDHTVHVYILFIRDDLRTSDKDVATYIRKEGHICAASQAVNLPAPAMTTSW